MSNRSRSPTSHEDSAPKIRKRVTPDPEKVKRIPEGEEEQKLLIELYRKGKRASVLMKGLMDGDTSKPLTSDEIAAKCGFTDRGMCVNQFTQYGSYGKYKILEKIQVPGEKKTKYRLTPAAVMARITAAGVTA